MLCEWTPDSIWIVDSSSRYFIEVNAAAQQRYGYSRDEFLAMKASDLHLQEDVPRLNPLLASGQGGKQRTVFFKQCTKKGNVLDVEIMCRPMEFDGRKAVICVARDVTEQRRTAEELAGAKERLAVLVSNAPVVFFAIDKEGIFTVSQGRGLAQLKRKPGEAVGRSVFEVYKHNARIAANMRRALAGEEFSDIVEESGRVYETYHIPERRDGCVAGVVGVAVDVTERMRAESLLLQHRMAMMASMDGMAILGPDETYLYLNDAHAKIYGYDFPSELVGKNWKALYGPEEVKRLQTEILPILYREGRWRGTGLGRRRDGTDFRQELSLSAIPGDGMICVVRDVSAREDVESTLERQRAAIEASTDGIHIEDKDRNIRFVNSALVRMHGYDRADDLLGNSWRVLHDDEEAGRIEKDIRPLLCRLRSWRGEVVGRRRDGTQFLQEVSATMMEDGGSVSVARDITERKRGEEERVRLLSAEKSARADAEQASRLKDEFMAILSHELRTPLTAMLGWTWMLKTGTLDPAGQTKALDIIHKNMQQQAQIIEDLLDVSRIVTGKLKLQTRLIDLQPVLNTVMENAKPAAAAKSIRLELDIAPSVGAVLGDPDRLQQAVWNLTSNAVKYTPEGGQVRIEVRKAGAKIEIRVIDTGQGISPEYLPFLFDRFRQAEQALTRTVRGLGLGLAIVKLLAESHGGTVEASSPGVGRGSTFIIRLPVPTLKLEEEAPAPAAGGERVRPSTWPRLDDVRVLVVDDDDGTRDMLETVLRHCGADVRSAASAVQALEIFVKFRPDVFISDILMPGEDGISLIRKIRAMDSEKGGRVPAAALTASSKVEDRTQVLLAGYQIYISKPVEPAELATVVGALAGRTPR